MRCIGWVGSMKVVMKRLGGGMMDVFERIDLVDFGIIWVL